MRRRYEAMAVMGLATSVALGATACGGTSSETDSTKCIGLSFASPKGGPGAIQMRVFPEFNRNFGDPRLMVVAGKILSGNDMGEAIKTPAGETAYGQFSFTWNLQESREQSSLVSADVAYDGANYRCPNTTIHFNPKTYAVNPHLANSPY